MKYPVALRTVLPPCVVNYSAIINHYFSRTRTVISNKHCRHSSCITFTVFIHQLEQCTQQKFYGTLNKAAHNSTFSCFFLVLWELSSQLKPRILNNVSLNCFPLIQFRSSKRLLEKGFKVQLWYGPKEIKIYWSYFKSSVFRLIRYG